MDHTGSLSFGNSGVKDMQLKEMLSVSKVIQNMKRKETRDLALWKVGVALGSRKLLENGSC